MKLRHIHLYIKITMHGGTMMYDFIVKLNLICRSVLHWLDIMWDASADFVPD